MTFLSRLIRRRRAARSLHIVAHFTDGSPVFKLDIERDGVALDEQLSAIGCASADMIAARPADEHSNLCFHLARIISSELERLKHTRERAL